MKERFFAVLMCLALMIGILSTTAMAAESVESSKCGENLTWTLENNVLTISGNGDMYDYDRNNTSPWYGRSIDSIVIKDGVTKIGGYSFLNCVGITEVSIPASVSVIGDYAFEGCKKLRRFVVDVDNGYYCNDKNGLLYTEDMQVLKCAPFAAEEMVLPETLCEIAYDAFSDGDNSNTIKFTGDAITYYGTTMFNNYIYIPEDNYTWTEATKGAFGSNMWFTYILEESGDNVSGIRGDVNCDGQITNADLIMTARYVVGLYEAESDEAAAVKEYGDMDGDGEVTNADIINIARIIVGMI